MKPPTYSAFICIIFAAICMMGCTLSNSLPVSDSDSTWQEEFDLSSCTFVTTGQNQYFILEPNFQLVLEGGSEVLKVTVLDEKVIIDGIETRVVEEREWKRGELIEVSRNFFAMCQETKDIFYFGEEVDMYKDGEIASHSGAWRAGENNAKAGLIMPGEPKVGMKYYQEIAPDVAMDRAEVVSIDETYSTTAGTFSDCLKTREGTALNPLEREFKRYAPGIRLIQDSNLLLTEYGFIDRE
ncbi:MAG: hypothetical protein GTO18_02555 [Anaerolineales bacterium]|nr:hypothetical protein [Anaerolineales bacterium]